MSVTITSSLRVGLVSGTGVTFNAPVVPFITTDDVFVPDNPSQTLTDLIDGISSAQLLAVALVDATTVGNYPLYTVPTGDVVFPTSVIFGLSEISGSGEPPAINLGVSGNFQEIIDSSRSTGYELTGGSIFAAGSGYAAADVLTLVGGTHSVVSTLTVNTTKLVSVAVNAAGTIYVPGDTITLAGGTSSTKAVLTVATVKLISAAIVSGGSGYGNAQTFTVTVAGGTFTTAATLSVTTDSGGIVTTVNSVSQAGNYTVLPSLTANAVTGNNSVDLGTGLTLNLVFGVRSVAITNAGSYTVNTATFTQFSTTSASGTGATFNTGLFGANTVSILAAGAYTVLPADHIAVTGGGGSGFTYDGGWTVTDSLFSDLTVVRQILSIQHFEDTASSTGADYKYIAAASPITLRVASASTYDAYTLSVYLFGFQITAP